MRTGLAEGPGEVPRSGKLTVRPLSDLGMVSRAKARRSAVRAFQHLAVHTIWRAIAVPLHGQ